MLVDALTNNLSDHNGFAAMSKRQQMIQTADECFNEWRSAFCNVIKLMDSREDLTAASRITTLLDTEKEWGRAGAYDGRAFYNDVIGSKDKIKLCEDVAWLEKYFILKYVEWSRPLAIS